MSHDGHRERLKQRFIKEGLNGFEPHNVLELLLFYSIPYKDTNEIAHALIERFGSLSEVLEAPVSELVKVNGVGEHSAVFLSMLPQVFQKYDEDKKSKGAVQGIDKIDELAASQLKGKTTEHFLLICMDSNDRLLNFHFISEGTVNSSKVDMRKIMRLILGSNATRVIIAHNHPRGGFEPSHADLVLTMELATLLRSVNVRLMDHVIAASDGSYMSFAQHQKKYSCYLSPR